MASIKNKRICENTNELKKILSLFWLFGGQKFKDFYKQLEKNELFRVAVSEKSVYHVIMHICHPTKN